MVNVPNINFYEQALNFSYNLLINLNFNLKKYTFCYYIFKFSLKYHFYYKSD